MSTEYKQGTPEWFQARIGRITGSRVGAILGKSPFKTKAVVLRDMVSESLGNNDDFDNPAMRWGRENEEKARHIYEFLYAGTDPVTQTGFWTHGEYLGASPDGLVGDDGLVEIKCPYKLRDEANPHFDDINERPDYMHQIQLQLLCTDRQWCDFFQWTPNGHYNVRVHRDPEWLSQHGEELSIFMDMYRQALENAAEGGPEERVGKSARWSAAVEAYELAKRVADAAKEDMDKAKGTLIDLCEKENIDRAEGSGYQLTKVMSEGRVDYKLLAQDNIAAPLDTIENDYRKPPSVSWRLTKQKEK